MAKRELSSNVRKLRFMQSNTNEKKLVPMKVDPQKTASEETSKADLPWHLEGYENAHKLYTESIASFGKGLYKVRHHTRKSFGEYNRIVDQFEKRTDDLLLKQSK